MDIDTDVNDKEKIVKHLQEFYGEDKVAQVCNFNYITPMVAVKDVAKILGIPYFVSDKISKSFTAKTWDECLEMNPNVLEKYSEYQELFDIAKHLSGRCKTMAMHAGGVVIAQTTLDDYIGISKGGNGENVINIDKKKCQPLGLIKFDILGLANLSIIQDVKNELNLDNWEIDINNPEFEFDQSIFELICSGKTNAIFQMESASMKKLIKNIKPTCLNDLSDISAISRPDAISMTDDYVNRKNGLVEIEYWHEDLQPIIGNTYGTILYQEQTMNVVRKLGGRSYAGADKFRKITASKQKDKALKESEILYYEIVENGYSEELAEKVKNFLSESGSYSFNYSHSLSYSVITMQTAYLKAHYPLYFFKALLNQNKGDFGNINKYIVDAKSFNIYVLPPNINSSELNFSISKDKILFGINAIKGIGAKVVDELIEQRSLSKFKNLEDLLSRVKLDKAQVVALIKSGAIPCKTKRSMLLKYANSLIEKREYKNVTTLTMSLGKLQEKYEIDFKVLSKEDRLLKLNYFKKIEFDILEEQRIKKHLYDFEEKYMNEESFWEFEALSIFLENNPFDKTISYLTPLEEVEDGGSVVLVGIIADIHKKKDRNKKDYCYFDLYSSSGTMEITAWSNQYQANIDCIKKGMQVAVSCTKKDFIQMNKIKPYSQWLEDLKLDI